MNKPDTREPMLDMFIFEALQLIEQLEQDVLSCESSSQLDSSAINEIFRIMHTIKGSARCSGAKHRIGGGQGNSRQYPGI